MRVHTIQDHFTKMKKMNKMNTKHASRLVAGFLALAVLVACSPSSTDPESEGDPGTGANASRSTQKNPPAESKPVASTPAPANAELSPGAKGAARTTGDSAGDSARNAEPKEITRPDGIRYKVLKEGTGNSPELGSKVAYHATCRLVRGGRVFWDSRKTGQPQESRLSYDELIEGLVEMLHEMKPGERRDVFVPHRLAYGNRGAVLLVPGRADITMDVELVHVH